ncbi:hypothetical protein BpHYR1_050844 [Brachionus plicatilis]|uniref:BED-type domain-containing protein n=1 Tax=Brachionus plicatilis TaxID=10195 RepID=A0A3M7PAY9_BRAPC|nr:hypothetical protein BpHYR1_050844 [Brachionus plicatilis]
MESSDISSGLESFHESSNSSESISPADNEEDSNRSNLRIDNSDVTSLAQTISSPDNSNSSILCTSTSILTQSPKRKNNFGQGKEKKKKKVTHDVKSYFEKRQDGNYCKFELPNRSFCNRKFSTTTASSSLKYHLDKEHGVVIKSEKGTTSKKFKPELDKMLVEIIDDLQPISLLSGSLGFKKKEMISQIKKFSKFLDLILTEDKFHITSDIWTSSSQDLYISVTVHFICNNNNLNSFLLDMKHFPGVYNNVTIASAMP